MNKKKLKIDAEFCLLAAPGGHISQLLSVKEIVSKESRFFLTFIDNNSDSKRIISTKLKNEKSLAIPDKYYHHRNNPINLIKSFFAFIGYTFLILKHTNFNKIITTGAGTGIIFTYICALLGKEIFFIESQAVQRATVFGKFATLISKKTFIQWDEQKNFHVNAENIGLLYSSEQNRKINLNFPPYIYFSAGSNNYPFERMIDYAIRLDKDLSYQRKIIVQKGNAELESSHIISFEYIDPLLHKMLIENSEVFITQASSSNMWEAISSGTKTLAIPRLHKYNEHIDNHQIFLATKYSDLGYVELINNYEDLVFSIKNNTKKGVIPENRYGLEKLKKIITDFI